MNNCAAIDVKGFASFEAEQASDGAVNFYGRAKVAGSTYFFMIKVTKGVNGEPRIGLTDARFETMTGKSVRGRANVILEDMMYSAKDAAKEWVSAL